MSLAGWNKRKRVDITYEYQTGKMGLHYGSHGH